MKFVSRVMIGLGLLLGSGVCAMADIVWTLNDVYLEYPHDGGINEVSGYFITDNSVDTIESFSIDVTGPETAGTFTATQMVDSYLPGVIGIANPGFSEYVDLYLAPLALTSAGGTINITSGYDCPGCGTLLVNSDYDPTVTGVVETGIADLGPVPEPSSIPFLGAGLLLMGVMMRRKLIRAS
jgi:PEP-CTERM motif